MRRLPSVQQTDRAASAVALGRRSTVHNSLGDEKDLSPLLTNTDGTTIDLPGVDLYTKFTPPQTVEFWVTSNAPNVVTSNRAVFTYTCG